VSIGGLIVPHLKAIKLFLTLKEKKKCWHSNWCADRLYQFL